MITQTKNKILSVIFYSGLAAAVFAAAIPLSAFEAHIINVNAKICDYSKTYTMGFWKNHPEIYKQYLPQTLGNETIDTVAEANQVFLDYNLSMRNKLLGQLLAMKFNIAAFGISEYYVESEGKTISQIVDEADALLIQDPPPPDSVLEEMKDLLDYLNNLHSIKFCSGDSFPESFLLQAVETYSDDYDSSNSEQDSFDEPIVEAIADNNAAVAVDVIAVEENNTTDNIEIISVEENNATTSSADSIEGADNNIQTAITTPEVLEDNATTTPANVGETGNNDELTASTIEDVQLINLDLNSTDASESNSDISQMQDQEQSNETENNQETQ